MARMQFVSNSLSTADPCFLAAELQGLQPRTAGGQRGRSVPIPAALAQGCSPEPQAATAGAVDARGFLWDASWVLKDCSAARWLSQKVSGRCPVGLCSYQRTSALCLTPTPRSGHLALPFLLQEHGKGRRKL